MKEMSVEGFGEEMTLLLGVVPPPPTIEPGDFVLNPSHRHLLCMLRVPGAVLGRSNDVDCKISLFINIGQGKNEI